MASKLKRQTLADLSSDVSYGYTESASEEKVGPKFLRITDIQNGVVTWPSVPYCPINDEDHRKHKLFEGDIVVARTGNSTGENYLFQGKEDAVFASFLIRYRINRKVADPQFVWYHMRAKQWWDYVASVKTGSAQAGANARVLGAFELCLPDLENQTKIGRFLRTFDDKIELNRRMNATLEAMARALFQSWFVDFDPVRAKLDGRKLASLDRATEPHFPACFEDSEIGSVPAGWKVASLSELMDIEGGTQPPASTFLGEQRENTVRLVQIRDFETDAHATWIEDSPRWRKCVPEDVMIARYGASVGRICWGLEGAYNVALVKVVPVSPEYREYLRSYLSSAFFQARLIGMSNRSAQAGFNKGDIASFKVCIPPSIVAKPYQDIAWSLRAKILQSRKESDTLARLRDSILPKLLSGELKVDDVKCR
jgi:type I restriction enzyme, S subunit